MPKPIRVRSPWRRPRPPSAPTKLEDLKQRDQQYRSPPAGAPITAPCDGWVVYVGPFRNDGQLLILNAGGEYHVLLAGMERISVDLGQFVETGEPVAVMDGGAQSAVAKAGGANQPVLYVEFRKDGIPVDPGPWWAVNEGQEVRG
jgi:murein hydrolase activator